MNRPIILLALFLSLSSQAQSNTPEVLESGWKSKAREFVSSLLGVQWEERLFGPRPLPASTEMLLPKIPKQFKKATDVSGYDKKIHGPTEYDNLPVETKRNYNYAFIQELFLVTRKSEVRDEDLASWLNTLDQGGSREGIYQALVLDEVYAALENLEEKPSEKLLEFYQKFSQRFYQQDIKRDSLENLNLFSLKRILTERGLDLLSYYESTNLEDLFQWYAIFSSELARDYDFLLKSKIRKDSSFEVHREWAKNMPIEHIKSEFIIKLHLVMNGLQLVQ
jgi:hypothetical protein